MSKKPSPLQVKNEMLMREVDALTTATSNLQIENQKLHAKCIEQGVKLVGLKRAGFDGEDPLNVQMKLFKAEMELIRHRRFMVMARSRLEGANDLWKISCELHEGAKRDDYDL